MSKEGRLLNQSMRLSLLLLLLTLLSFLPIVIEGQGYEYRKGYLKYRGPIGTATFTQSTQSVYLSGQLTDVCSQLWLPADQFPPPENEPLYLSRASTDSASRYWYWNSLFSDYFVQDVGELLERQFPAISLLIWPAEMNQNISTPFFIDYEEDPREVSSFDPCLSGFVFQVSYLPWDIELVSKDPEPEDYDLLDRWENESVALEETINSLWYINTFSFHETEVSSGGYPTPINPEFLVLILVLGGGIFIGLFLVQRSRKQVPKEFAHYFADDKSKNMHIAPAIIPEKKCVNCKEVLPRQSQFCVYCGSEQPLPTENNY